jgi:hypothetical protein
MSKQLTIEIPENIYQQVEKTARATNRRVAEVITDTLAESFLYQNPPLDREIESDEQPYPPRVHIEAMDKEIEAYKKMHSQLWKEYPHQFVAIHQGKLIDHDKEFAALVERVQDKYPYPEHIVLMREVQSDPDPVLYFRSPRLVRD